MKRALGTVGIIVVAILGLQTYESARLHEVSLTCVADEGESSDCVSLGPLGVVNPSGFEFWVTRFIDHGAELSWTLGRMLRK